MKKIRYAICLMALLFCACSEDKKDGPITELTPDEKNKWELILDEYGLNPSQRENINSIGEVFSVGNTKLLLGQRNCNAWIACFDNNGDGLKPFGDRIEEEGMIYMPDTTYLEGNKIKYVYSEKKQITDEISGNVKYKVLDRYCYDIDIKNYRVSFAGKIK